MAKVFNVGSGGAGGNVVTSDGGASMQYSQGVGDAPFRIIMNDEDEPPLSAEDVNYSATQTVKDAIDSLKETTGGVASFNGRTGVVVPAAGDYDADDVSYSDTQSVKDVIDELKATPGGVTSFKGRTGAVIPASGDYSVGQITGAAPIQNPVFSNSIFFGSDGSGSESSFLASVVDFSIINDSFACDKSILLAGSSYSGSSYNSVVLSFSSQNIASDRSILSFGGSGFNGSNISASYSVLFGSVDAGESTNINFTNSIAVGTFDFSGENFNTNNFSLFGSISRSRLYGNIENYAYTSISDNSSIRGMVILATDGADSFSYGGMNLGRNSSIEGNALGQNLTTEDSAHIEGYNGVLTALSLQEYNNPSILRNFSIYCGMGSHIEGYHTYGYYGLNQSPAFCATRLTGYGNHAEGYNAGAKVYTIVNGNGIHVGGYGNQVNVTGRGLFIGGEENKIGSFSRDANGNEAGTSVTFSKSAVILCSNMQTSDSDSFMYGYTYLGGNPKIDSVPSDAGGLLVVGAGSNSPMNAFRVSDSAVYGGQYNTSGADYAEMFEWADGNVLEEDRVGHFVTLDGDKIRIATSIDDFILGVTSGNPSIVGDSHDDQWKKMVMTDVYGRPIKEEINVPAEYMDEPAPTDDDPNHVNHTLIRPAHTETVLKINPDYNQNEKYIPRSDRPEWSVVGMMGKLVVIDDGTCVVNGWAKSNDSGIATKSGNKTKFRVMKRVDETHVQILIL